MFELRCTVRGCSETLELNDDGLRCKTGHHFDRAKGGYWNLLQPQDKRSLKPGDADEAVLARHRWLERGYATKLVDALKPWTNLSSDTETSTIQRVVDLGCGEGSFGPALFSDNAKNYCGIDLSKRAIKLAARRWPEATWVLANADRTLPVVDASVHQVVSLFGRRPVVEIRRVLADEGNCIVAVPGDDDLIELREQVQQAGHRRSRWELVVEAMAKAGLECVEHKVWKQEVDLAPEEIADALAMTYRAARRSEQAKLESLTAMKVTLSADLILFRPEN
jgi:23S rRNA (guanine745-N1)-methyltransferase